MLGGDGEARGRVYFTFEAQKWEDHSNAAVHHIFCPSFFDFTSREDEEEEEGFTAQKLEVDGRMVERKSLGNPILRAPLVLKIPSGMEVAPPLLMGFLS